MSKIEEIEKEVQGLKPNELQAFRKWFWDFNAKAWDRQFEKDALSGKLDSLAESSLTNEFISKASCLSFPLVGNPSSERFWTSQNDRKCLGYVVLHMNSLVSHLSLGTAPKFEAFCLARVLGTL